jgi:hypothetical protein
MGTMGDRKMNPQNESEFRQWISQQDAEEEERLLSRNIPISKQPEDIQEIRFSEGKEQ